MANEDGISEKKIIDFLKKNKNFFIKNSELVKDLNFPLSDNSSDKAENLAQLDNKIANSYFKNKMVSNLNQNPKGLLIFFPNKSTIIKSYILLKVKFGEDTIILAMGSKDKNKFTVDMQTDLVEYLIKIIEINLLNIT